MPVQNEELGIIGVAVAALAFVAKALLDELGKRRTTTGSERIDSLCEQLRSALKSLDAAAETLRAQTGVHARASDAYIAQLARVADHVEELLRMHRDPGSQFSNAKTERLLETLLRDVAVLSARLKP